MEPVPQIPTGKYRHYKGGIYSVEGVATHSETLEAMVVYRGENGDLWARPANMFLDAVRSGEEDVPRFTRMDG